MDVNVTVTSNNKTKTLALNETVYNQSFNEALIHQAVVAYQAAARSGTQKQKTRGEVSGGGKKPWRQKGTGRARSGTIRSPIWRGGGIHFAARPRDYTQKINKKMYKGAVRSLLSELMRQQRLIIVDKLDTESPKTRYLKNQLQNWVGEVDALIVCNEIDQNLFLSARNLAGVEVTDVYGINPVNLLDHAYLIMTEEAAKKAEEIFQ